MIDLSGKQVVVVGLGKSGSSTARALLAAGAAVRVTEGSSSAAILEQADALEKLGAVVETGGHDLAGLRGDLAVLSPGVPLHAPVVRTLVDAGVPLWSEIELAYRMADCDLLAVTGTNGKTTTTSLLAAMLQEAGIPSAAAGNIGLPLIDVVKDIGPEGAIAVEVSSFQLATIRSFHPKVAVVLNVAEDHTDWHGTVEAYAADKARVTINQGASDTLLVNADDEWCMKIAAGSHARVVPFSRERVPEGGVGVESGRLRLYGGSLTAIDELPLAGAAGLEDTLAAAGAAEAYGIEHGAIERAIKRFRPLSHRLEEVAAFGGVTYINDSKATNPHATLAAVQGLTGVVLIAGGRSKGIDLAPLREAVPPVVAVVALGEATEEIARVFEGMVPVDRAASMEAAVTLATRRSSSGGSVLLSPGCASLDMYESYAARGEHFARAVRAVMDTSTNEGTGESGNA
ncbi:MAG: UDP-N-acetylmuramoyl-L-alanine--D-glutamate ligase [Actinomycetota bacterium]